MGIITLTTDFGTKDEFVGVMKGVIFSISPDAKIVDITHEIPPQDILQGAFFTRASCNYFPKGTVHLVVVDPGVGSDRSILVVKREDACFVAPNNGVLSFLFEDGQPTEIFEAVNSKYFLNRISHTFHGRDIMAPVAAHLSAGIPPDVLGIQVNPSELVRLDFPDPFLNRNGDLSGNIISVDRFGNLVTNISEKLLHETMTQYGASSICVLLGDKKIEGLKENYHSVDRLKPLAIIGSRGFLEVSVNFGNAQTFFNVKPSDSLKVVFYT